MRDRVRPANQGGTWAALGLLFLLGLLGSSLAAPPAPAAAVPADPPPPRVLLVQVREHSADALGAARRGADNSYTVSTQGGGDRDTRATADDNGSTVSTGGGVHVLRVLEGERLRVDLPAVQSLQFHVPAASLPGNASRTAATGAPGSRGAGAGSAGGAAAAAAGSAVSGVVYFEAVAAFSVRFALDGARVRIELQPLQAGRVAAPLVLPSGATDPAPVPMLISGRVGEWIALGDTALAGGARSLLPIAQAPSAPGVWVRVEPETP